MWNYTILMLVNDGIPTGSEPGQSSQAGAELSTQPSEAPPCSFVHGYIYTCILQMLNTHQSALHLLQSYIS